MTDRFVDTDILIRMLTGNDPDKQAASVSLFGQVASGDITVAAPESVVADAVHVLSSPRLYALFRDRVRQLLTPLVRLTSFHGRNRCEVLRALDLFATTRLDFGDALVAAMEQDGTSDRYSY